MSEINPIKEFLEYLPTYEWREVDYLLLNAFNVCMHEAGWFFKNDTELLTALNLLISEYNILEASDCGTKIRKIKHG